MTEAQKKKIAARQDFICANKPNQVNAGLENYDCPFWKYRDGRFDESGYDIDHIKELGDNGEDLPDNCQALCLCCHRVKTSRFNITKNKVK